MGNHQPYSIRADSHLTTGLLDNTTVCDERSTLGPRPLRNPSHTHFTFSQGIKDWSEAADSKPWERDTCLSEFLLLKPCSGDDATAVHTQLNFSISSHCWVCWSFWSNRCGCLSSQVCHGGEAILWCTEGVNCIPPKPNGT